jgi:hypothetical protein
MRVLIVDALDLSQREKTPAGHVELWASVRGQGDLQHITLSREARWGVLIVDDGFTPV